MKLDKRIESESLICTPFSNTVANLHEKGYFANDFQAFSDLEQCKYGTLVSCNFDGNYPYIWGSCTICYNTAGFAFYIPESSLKLVESNLKPKEKKYRPYTLMEFNDKFTVGRPIKYRSKDEAGREHYLMLLGFWLASDKDQTIPYISIGNFKYTLQELFEEYEWQEHYTEDFKPFGVEEE